MVMFNGSRMLNIRPAPWYTNGLTIGGIGDSIMAGHPYPPGYLAPLEGGPDGDPTWQSLYQLQLLYPAGFTFYNGGVGSTGASALAGELNTVIPLSPVAVICHSGINDLASGAVFADVSATYDTQKGRLDTAGIHLFMDQILPWTSGNDTQAAEVRTWNTALASWCTGNGATLIASHDGMGQLRVSTGQLDDLKTAYDADGIHPNKAGYTALAAIYKTALAAYYGV